MATDKSAELEAQLLEGFRRLTDERQVRILDLIALEAIALQEGSGGLLRRMPRPNPTGAPALRLVVDNTQVRP